MSENRANTICLLEILREYSDADNILSMKDITTKMEMLYNIRIDRRTVYKNMYFLIRFGYDISMFEENGKGYYLRERTFDTSEIRLLMDSVYANTAIPPKQSVQLVEKLQKFVSVHKRKYYSPLKIYRENVKTPNKETFYNISILDEAIASQKKVSFIYTEYGYDKKLHPKGNYRRTVSPYNTAIYDGNYYLICGLDGVDKPRHYHICKMKNIELMDEKAEPAPSTFHLDDYMRKSVFMYGGKTERIKMRCHKYILDAVITRFGTDINIRPNGDDTFTATLYANPDGMYVWGLQFIDTCEILEPKSLRERICEVVKNSPYK